MAQTVYIIINSTTPAVSILVTSDNSATYSYIGSGRDVVFAPSPQSLDLSEATAMMAINSDLGMSAQFKFSEITLFEINGVDQLASLASDLQDVVDLCAPFFFDNGGEMTVAMQTDGGVNFIDCLNRRVDIVRVTNGGAATITEIRNVPVGHVVHVFPKNFDMTVTKTAYASLTAWQVGGVAGSNTMQSSVGEVFTCIGNVKSDGTRYVNQLVANISFV